MREAGGREAGREEFCLHDTSLLWPKLRLQCGSKNPSDGDGLAGCEGGTGCDGTCEAVWVLFRVVPEAFTGRLVIDGK